MNRPRSVVCYICGREYGTASIEIHIKSCIKKFENEQLQKPKKDRRPLPQPTQKIGGVKNMNADQLNEYNQQQFKQYNDTALVPCENCGRTFREEALAHHIKGCSSKNPYKAGTEKQGDLVPCGQCGRKFAPERVAKHESVCKGGSGQGQQSTSSPQKSFGSTGSTNSPQKSFGSSSPQKQPLRPKTIMCYICGREFGTKSLSIHMKTCREKFANEQAKKPKSERKPLPSEPAGLQELLSKPNISHQDIEEYNNMAFNKYNTDCLEACPNCARTFTAEALSHHIKACKPKHGAQSKGTSSPMKEKVFRKPKVVMCHICGREYGTASISIHIPQCEKKWINEQSKLPPNQRKPVPQAPKQMIDLSNASQDQIDKFNQDAYQNYNDQAMTQCPYCNRTFTSEAFKHHQKACTKEKPMAAVKPIKNVDSQQIGGNSNFQVDEFQQESVSLQPCSKCGRKFNPDRIAKHEGICKGK